MRHLKKEDILFIHSMVIDETSGMHGVRDYNAVLSLEELPKQKAFGKELYPSVFIKAAVYARTIIMNHPFIDGNKRTGVAAAVTFLEGNEHDFIAREGEIEQFALEIVSKRYSVEETAEWLKEHSKK